MTVSTNLIAFCAVAVAASTYLLTDDFNTSLLITVVVFSLLALGDFVLNKPNRYSKIPSNNLEEGDLGIQQTGGGREDFSVPGVNLLMGSTHKSKPKSSKIKSTPVSESSQSQTSSGSNLPSESEESVKSRHRAQTDTNSESDTSTSTDSETTSNSDTSSGTNSSTDSYSKDLHTKQAKSNDKRKHRKHDKRSARRSSSYASSTEYEYIKIPVRRKAIYQPKPVKPHHNPYIASKYQNSDSADIRRSHRKRGVYLPPKPECKPVKRNRHDKNGKGDKHDKNGKRHGTKHSKPWYMIRDHKGRERDLRYWNPAHHR